MSKNKHQHESAGSMLLEDNQDSKDFFEYSKYASEFDAYEVRNAIVDHIHDILDDRLCLDCEIW